MAESITGIPFLPEELAELRQSMDVQEREKFYWNILGYRLRGSSARDLMVKKLRVLTAEMKSQHSVTPGLGIIQSGDDPASNTYVGIKEKKAEEAGFHVVKKQYKAGTDQETVLQAIHEFNEREDIHGFIVQLPLLPEKSFHLEEIIMAIDPAKDADCFHPINVGRFYSGDGYDLAPATPLGSLVILQMYGVPLEDCNGKPYAAAIAGRSDIAGKPFGRVLEAKQNGYHLSYHLMNSHSDTHGVFSSGNYQVLISAIGRREYTQEDVPIGTPVLIDVGTNFIQDADGKKKQVGDFDPAAYDHARVILPSPGGTGPGTVTALLVNTFHLAERNISS